MAVANSERSSSVSSSRWVRFFLGRRTLGRWSEPPKRVVSHWPSQERSMTRLLHYGAGPIGGSRNLRSDERFAQLKGTIPQTLFALANECKWNPVRIVKKLTIIH